MSEKLCLALLVAVSLAPQVARGQVADAQQAASSAEYKRIVAPFLVKHCGECHGSKQPKKELELSRLEPDMQASTSAARWAAVLEQLRSGEMPPADKKRPDATATQAVITWIQAEMKRAGKHVARRESYTNGNSVDHEVLFNSKSPGKFDSPPGVRRLSPEIYATLAGELAKGVDGIGQPFSVGGRNTFKDMGAPKLDEPTTAQLIRNAVLIVERKLTAFKVEGESLKAAGQGTPKQFLRLLDVRSPPTDAEIELAIRHMFDLALRRQPSAPELERFVALYMQNVKDAGQVTGTRFTLAAVLLLPEAVFRFEQGHGEADPQGRVRLAPREIAFAVSYTLADRRPDTWLLNLAEQGHLDTAAGVGKAVQQMLDNPKLEKPRILRFFREYFQYDQATEVFKDNKAYPEHDARVLVEDTDRLVQHILAQDQAVLLQLLTTNKSFVAYKSAAETKQNRAAALAKFEDEKQKDPPKFANKKPPQVGRSIYESYNLADFPDAQPVELPAAQRAGILTQPSWLVAFSKSDENHAILRGKWVRERLLGNVVPDIPITVDAQLPHAPEQTLRQRMEVTQQEYCWQCHKLMNRTGYPFENYDHLGRFRSAELVLDRAATAAHVDQRGKDLGDVFKAVPADATGGVEFVGDERCEGNVQNAVELMHRLAKSERVEQVFIRHNFRYWLGRDETPGDAATLQAVYKTYHDSGGSMRALITALLTSESFLFRVPSAAPAADQQ